MSIIIDEEFKGLIPPLSDDEYRQLEENCIRDGIRDPLVTWPQDDGTEILIDGHNRWKISAQNSGIPFKVERMKFESREKAKEWILKNQLGRRNIPTYIKAQLALKLESIIAEKAKERMVIAPQNSAEHEREIKKIWSEHDYDTARNLVAIKKQEYAKERRRETMRAGKHIYFARIGKDQIKVGSSNCPAERIKQLSVSSPDIELIESVFYGVGAEKHENVLKKKFGEYRVGNECYQCSDDVLRQMISFTKKEAARNDNTSYVLAKIAGVSHDTIHKVKVIEKSAPEPIKEAARRGDISVNKAYQLTTQKPPAARMKDFIDETQQRHEEFKDSDSVNIADVRQDKTDRKVLAGEMFRRCMASGKPVSDLYFDCIETKRFNLREMSKELTPEQRESLRNAFVRLIANITELSMEVVED